MDHLQSPGRRRALVGAGCLLGGIAGRTYAAEKLPRLVLAGPSAIVSAPLIHMVETGALVDVAHQVSFVQWRDPDQLRVMALQGQADVLAIPTNVAATLFNRGAPVTLLNVSTWGVLWILSRSADLKTLADYRGEEIVVPFRGDMPDIVFQLLAEAQKLDLKRDLKVRYVATPIEAMQLLITRRVDHALLAEPAVSMALRKTQSFPVSLIAPTLHRGVDMQVEWGRVFDCPPRIPQAGIAAIASIRDRPDLLARIQAAYADSVAACLADPVACGKLMAAHVPQLTPEAVADALPASRLEAVNGPQAREELEAFFSRLIRKDPGLVGGKLPADGFYAAV